MPVYHNSFALDAWIEIALDINNPRIAFVFVAYGIKEVLKSPQLVNTRHTSIAASLGVSILICLVSGFDCLDYSVNLVYDTLSKANATIFFSKLVKVLQITINI